MSYRAIGYAAALLASAGVGWLARGPAETDAPAPLAVRSVPAPAPVAASTDNAPLIAVASDGNVTLRVEQQPLEWVLEQIAAQSGWADVKARARSVPADTTTARTESVVCAERATPGDAGRVLHAIERGTEAERFDGLLRARSEGVAVAEQTLKVLYETDASERVRLTAFEGYLELRAEAHDLRRVLEAALYVPSAAIQRDAKRRLEEMHEIERHHALAGHSDP